MFIRVFPLFRRIHDNFIKTLLFIFQTDNKNLLALGDTHRKYLFFIANGTK